MNPHTHNKFPHDFFENPPSTNIKRKKYILPPLCIKAKVKNISLNPAQDLTPYFKPLAKHSSCVNILRPYETPNISKVKPSLLKTKKVILPTLKPHLHSKKNEVNLRSTLAFEKLDDKFFEKNEDKFLGVTFSRNTMINSRESLASNIFSK